MKSYPYKPTLWVGPFSFLVMGALAYVYYTKTINHEAFDFKGLHYEGDTALWIHSGITVFCVSMSIMGLAIIYEMLFGAEKIIKITDSDIAMPSLLFKRETTLKFEDIIELEERGHDKNLFLILKARHDRTSISSTMLNAADYEEIRDILLTKSFAGKQIIKNAQKPQ